ncbi:N-acetylmuramoyl-L-alanine amidase family protein [Aequorivita antarctica]|uniref:N-acetylmuramoyl-L-alanine amidase n=1 Tax=Aequorivita antarctica TaxID=153266 RepID=A0A5C6YZW0_9FLAO|nr:N-acetylmuramoyl-L-alanine amidase [Aequorivita antarctica]TXD72752.1 N-acetylmuramoyl-L-alanine amidase [Aequorivita antarctica]SRX76379.1 N-acetylmuramoyl-L-alanine amidase LytC [Aequorivita antarctica]
MVQFKVLFAIVLALKIVGFQNHILAQTNQNRKQIIVIDPGHGGTDSGAVGINGIQEKDVVLKIAKQIVVLNNSVFMNQHEIYLTRNKDTLISLGDRTKLAKALQADIFISLHCNHSDNPNVRGLEVYASKKQGKYSRKSILLAYELQKELKENLGFESRGVKFGDFQVLRETTNLCPTVLLEMGFLSQMAEVIYLSNEKSQYSVSLVILQSTLIY